jgi:dTMP kinase
MKQLKQGILITIEGIDGSGKSTLANKLRDSLQKKQLPVILTYEPGDTEIGKQLRKALQERPVPLCDKTEFLLYAADRAQHIQDVVLPQLNKKKIVLSDRMADSALAYQGYGRGLDLGIIQTVNNWVMQGIKPDLTLYIKISTQSAVARLKKRKGRPTSIEQEKEAFTKKVINGFDTIFATRNNVIILDGEQSADMLHKIAHANIVKFLKTFLVA